MILPFCEEVVNDKAISCESFKYPNFMGYLNPSGVPIDFRDKFGYTSHGDTSIQEAFRVYYILKIRNSKWTTALDEYIMSEQYQHSEKERYINFLERMLKEAKERLEQQKRYAASFTLEQMRFDIYSFLINCYRANTFFEGVGKIETCMSEQEFWELEYKNKSLYNITDWNFNVEYSLYKDRILVDIFKNVMIQYLGYHSIERVPKTITTSAVNTYEVFYNYILNDFKIQKLPRMVYDITKKMYVPYDLNQFLIPDSELRLKEELQAIRKLVPLNERSKYYR